jgi:DNA invertase Pin-like site-specific DNA recombinase
MGQLTKREAERRERYYLFDDLSEEQRAEIKRLYSNRCRIDDIAEQFETDLATVFRVVTGGSEVRKKVRRKK